MTLRLPGLLCCLAAVFVSGCVSDGNRSPTRTSVAPSAEPTRGPVHVFTRAERNPDRLRKLTPEGVAKLIGMPHYVRHEGGLIIWQYLAGSCVMDLFWERTEAELLFLDYEVRGARLQRVAEAESCFGDLLVRRHTATES